MKLIIRSFLVCSILTLFITGCKNKGGFANIPDSNEILSNVAYLDSLVRSPETDSIEQVLSSIHVKINAYNNNIWSATDKLIIDSLQLITIPVKNYVQYCSDIQPDLEVLRQDIIMLNEEYRSGKIRLQEYVSNLMEKDQTLIQLSDNVYYMRDEVYHLLSRYAYLSGMLGTQQYESQQAY